MYLFIRSPPFFFPAFPVFLASFYLLRLLPLGFSRQFVFISFFLMTWQATVYIALWWRLGFAWGLTGA